MTYEKNIAQLKRRDFLKLAGKAGLSLNVLRASSLGAGAFLGSRAMAAPVDKRRVIFVYIPDGTPNGASETYTPSSSLDLKTCSKPLESVKDECVFMNGVSIDGGGGHGVSQRVLGAFANDAGSIDLALGDTVGAVSPISSLRLGVRTRNVDPVSARGWSAANDYQDSPLAAFDRLFGGSTDSSPIGTRRDLQIQAMNQAALEQIKAKLGSYELDRLEKHEAAIAKVQQTITSAASSGGDGSGGACQNALYNIAGLDDEQVDTKFTNLFKLQTENAILALNCNITRVVSIQLGTHQADFAVTDLKGDYHSSIHSGDVDYYASYRTYFSSLMAHLIQSLKNTDDLDGSGNMLDSTLVVQVTDMGDGNSHGAEDAPFMMAGGGDAVNRGSVINVSNHHRLFDNVKEYMGVSGSLPAYDPQGAVPGILT